MTCLNDSQIQALADGEADSASKQHAAGCARCAARVRERAALMSRIERSIDVPVEAPASLTRRVEESLHGGATRLRTVRGAGLRTGRRGWIYSGLAVAAATLAAVLFVVPTVRKADTTVSAAEILAKSASRLSAPIASGVEVLEYELVLDGVPKDMVPDSTDGTYRVWQAIDHNVEGRFRFASFLPDGRMLTSIAQDPLTKRRVMSFVIDDQAYRFEVSLPSKATGMSLPELERLHMEASIAMMQASGNQLLETIDGPRGKLYRIEVPHVSGPGTNPVWDLTEARVLVDARDYRVTEFAVRGTFLKQAYSLSYRLISRTIAASLKPDAFVVPSRAGEIVIRGEGSTVPIHDVVVLSLRELAKLKQAQ